MKKLFFSLVLLFAIYFGIKWSFVYFSTGHEINYELKKDEHIFKINEIFKARQARDRDNYFLSINFNNTLFTYQVFDNFDKGSKIIQDIKYYSSDKQSCILPIFKDNRILFDVMCYDGEQFIYYNNIINPNESLKTFVSNLASYNYVEKNWVDSNKVLKISSNITVYNNLIKNHYIGVSNYKGVFSINKSSGIKNIGVFNKDIYQQVISGYVNDSYIIADYTGINSFNEFEIVNIKSGAISKIKSPNPISYNSYVLGSVDDSMYIYDRDNRLEYEINTKKQMISIVGKKDKTIKFYSNGNWVDMNVDSFVDNMVFDSAYESSYQNKIYIRAVKIGEESGYLYLIKKVENEYAVYRTNIQDKEKLTYLFNTTDYQKLIFLDDYVYYLYNNDLKYYSDKTGNRKVLTNSEIEFNKTIKFSIYEEK